MLEARNLSVAIGKARLLDGIDALCRPGRVTAIVGPNGAGKSTLLACLAGLREPERGTVLIDGAALAGMDGKARARRIGYLPQDATLHWNIAVRTLVALGRYPHGDAGTATGQAAIARALAQAGLGDLAERLAASLSGGERARALLARVLAGEPDWVLADEPMAALDIAHRYALMDQLRAVAAGGAGVVIVLHDLALAARLADDALLLAGGRVAAAGPAAQVLTPDVLRPVFGVEFAWAQTGRGPALVSVPAG